MSELLGIDIKNLYSGGSQFYQTVSMRKLLEATGMDHYNGFPIPTKIEAPLGEYDNGPESHIYCPNFILLLYGLCCICHQTKYHMYPFLLINVPGLHITSSHHMR